MNTNNTQAVKEQCAGSKDTLESMSRDLYLGSPSEVTGRDLGFTCSFSRLFVDPSVDGGANL